VADFHQPPTSMSISNLPPELLLKVFSHCCSSDDQNMRPENLTTAANIDHAIELGEDGLVEHRLKSFARTASKVSTHWSNLVNSEKACWYFLFVLDSANEA